MTEKPHLWLGFAPKGVPDDWEYRATTMYEPLEPEDGDILQLGTREYVFRDGSFFAATGERAEKRAEALSPKSSGDRP